MWVGVGVGVGVGFGVGFDVGFTVAVGDALGAASSVQAGNMHKADNSMQIASRILIILRFMVYTSNKIYIFGKN